MDWKYHKTACGKIETGHKPTQAKTTPASSMMDECFSSGSDSITVIDETTEKRECRCMFCGENLVMGSEAEAIEHMRVCPALQEQLKSKDQFHIPSMFRDKMG